MSSEKRTPVGLPKNGVYIPTSLQDHTVEIGPLVFEERAVYLDGVRIGVVYPSETHTGRPVSRGSNIVGRQSTQKVWRIRGDRPLSMGTSRYWETRRAAVWALVVRYVEVMAQEAADARQ